MSDVLDGARVAARLVTGRQLNGERKTNARWSTPGTELRDGAEHAGWWSHLPLRRRAGIRAGVLVWLVLHAAGLLVDFDRTVITLRVQVWIGLAIGTWVIVHKTRKWSHHTGYVVPVAMAVADWLGQSRHVDPRSLVAIPLGHRTNPDKPVRIYLPATFRESHARQKALAAMVAARAGIKSFDWETLLEGAAPMMLVRHQLVPPDEVLYDDEHDARVRELIEGNRDDSRLLLGLGLHEVPVWIDWNQDAPHLALSIGSGGGKSTMVRSLAAQTVYKGGRAVLMDGGKDGESHQDWARDELMRPIPGVDFHPSIAEEHDALVAWEAERARRAQAVLNRTGEVFQRTLVVLEERNLTTPKLQAYWAMVRDKDAGDPVKSPAIQAMANLTAAGRSVKINLVGIAQRFDANVIGGGAVRSSFGLRLLSRFDEQARRMLIPEITPKPKSSNHLGRSILCVQGEARDLQGVYMSAEAAVDLCRRGEQPDRMPTVVVRKRPHEDPVSPVSPVEVTPRSPGDSAVPGADRGHLALVPAPVEDPPRETLVTLREAWTGGLVGGEWEALRKAAQRDGFPAHTDEGARGARLYKPSALAGWWAAKVERSAADGGRSS